MLCLHVCVCVCVFVRMQGWLWGLESLECTRMEAFALPDHIILLVHMKVLPLSI